MTASVKIGKSKNPRDAKKDIIQLLANLNARLIMVQKNVGNLLDYCKQPEESEWLRTQTCHSFTMLIVSVAVPLEAAKDNEFSQTIKTIMSEIEMIMAKHNKGTVQNVL